MTLDPALERLVRLAEVNEPASSTSSGAAYLRRVAATYARYATEPHLLRVMTVGSVSDLSLPADRGEIVAAAWDLGVIGERVDAVLARDLVWQAADGLQHAALRLLTALVAYQCTANSLPSSVATDEGSAQRLRRDEDARLRTLSAMRHFGLLSPSTEIVRSALRARDMRADVREPDEVTIVPVAED